MKSANLTKRQQAVLQFIEDYAEAEGRSPTLTEIAKGVGSSAVSTIHKHVQHLTDKGFLERSHGKGNNLVLKGAGETSRSSAELLGLDARNVEPRSFDHRHTESRNPEPRQIARLLPFCGDIAAGAPLIPEDKAIPLEVPLTIHRERDECFVLRVRGDSMIEDAILDGDLVVLQKKSDYRNGDRVAALIDGEEATLKEFRRDAKGVWLIPHNPDLKPLCFTPDRIQVQGLLIGVMRSC
ncbi:MAG: transcriptional repressor LexA [Holophagaceae bacterium]|nr:transcriptional repressor LexA [Holophagaceae bacterium]